MKLGDTGFDLDTIEDENKTKTKGSFKVEIPDSVCIPNMKDYNIDISVRNHLALKVEVNQLSTEGYINQNKIEYLLSLDSNIRYNDKRLYTIFDSTTYLQEALIDYRKIIAGEAKDLAMKFKRGFAIILDGLFDLESDSTTVAATKIYKYLSEIKDCVLELRYSITDEDITHYQEISDTDILSNLDKTVIANTVDLSLILDNLGNKELSELELLTTSLPTAKLTNLTDLANYVNDDRYLSKEQILLEKVYTLFSGIGENDCVLSIEEYYLYLRGITNLQQEILKDANWFRSCIELYNNILV